MRINYAIIIFRFVTAGVTANIFTDELGIYSHHYPSHIFLYIIPIDKKINHKIPFMWIIINITFIIVIIISNPIKVLYCK